MLTHITGNLSQLCKLVMMWVVALLLLFVLLFQLKCNVKGMNTIGVLEIATVAGGIHHPLSLPLPIPVAVINHTTLYFTTQHLSFLLHAANSFLASSIHTNMHLLKNK